MIPGFQIVGALLFVFNQERGRYRLDRQQLAEWLKTQLAKFPPLTPERWAKITAEVARKEA